MYAIRLYTKSITINDSSFLHFLRVRFRWTSRNINIFFSSLLQQGQIQKWRSATQGETWENRTESAGWKEEGCQRNAAHVFGGRYEKK